MWDFDHARVLGCEAALFSGLHDADYHRYLIDTAGATPYYTSHFYDPDTRKNYWEDDSPTAVERGRDFFMASLKVLTYPNGNVRFDIGRRSWYSNPLAPNLGPLKLEMVNAGTNDRWRASFKMLGIALHYLTDLTQPMHAANIANIYGGRRNPLLDWRHSKYEEYAERLTRSGHLFDNYPPLPAELMKLPSGLITCIDDLYIHVAKVSKSIWLKDVKPIFDKKGYSEAWGDEAKPAVLDSTHQAPYAVARCLLYWTYLIPPDKRNFT